MTDKDLVAALDRNSEAMNNVSKMTYLTYMGQQLAMASRTPSNTQWHSIAINPTNQVRVPTWHQILPRNPRRHSVTFMAINTTFYFSIGPNALSIPDLITYDNNKYEGEVPVAAFTFVGGMPITIPTSDSIQVAALTGGGSQVEFKTVLNWCENIYSDVSGNPFYSPASGMANAGKIQKLTAGLMRELGIDLDIESTYTHDGVR